MELNFKKIGSGPALFIVHGLYGSGDNWLSIGRELASDFTVYLIDLRNHGNSPHSAEHNYSVMANDLFGLYKREQLSELVIIGHSMGGKAAMTLTLEHPGIVKKLICVDISPFSYFDQGHVKGQFSFHKTVLELYQSAPLGMAKSRSELENYFRKGVNDLATRKFLLKNLKRSQEKQFYWQLNIPALLANLQNIVDAIPPVKLGAQSFVPAYFMYGGKSGYITQDDLGAISDIFKSAKFTCFENSGHWLHAEEPERFINTTKGFLLS